MQSCIIRGAKVDAEALTAASPAPLWKHPIGQGFSGIGIQSGVLYSLSSKNGTLYWRRRGFQLASVLALEHDLLLALDYACEVTLIRVSAGRY